MNCNYCLLSFLCRGWRRGSERNAASRAEKLFHCYPNFLQALVWFFKSTRNSICDVWVYLAIYILVDLKKKKKPETALNPSREWSCCWSPLYGVSLMTVWWTATALGEFTVCLVLLPCHSHSQSFTECWEGFSCYQSTPFSLEMVEWMDGPS